MWKLKPFSTYNSKSQKSCTFPNNTKCRDLRTFAEIFWPRKAAAWKSIDFWDSGPQFTTVSGQSLTCGLFTQCKLLTLLVVLLYWKEEGYAGLVSRKAGREGLDIPVYCSSFLYRRVISVVTSHQYCNTLTAHFAYPSVADCYFSFGLDLMSNISS